MDMRDRGHVILEIPAGSSWTDSIEIARKLEQTFLPEFLSRARWYPERAASQIKPQLLGLVPFSNDSNSTVLAVIETSPQHARRYILPLRIEWSGDAPNGKINGVVASLHQGERVGSLRDVASDPQFIASMLDSIRQQKSMTTPDCGWRIDFCPTSKLSKQASRHPAHIRPIEGEQSNSTALVDQDFVVKLYRRIEAGENPEVEMGHFLTEIVGFPHTPALLGHVHAVHQSQTYALGVVHGFVANRGDAWKYSAQCIDAFLDETMVSERSPRSDGLKTEYLDWVGKMGRRIAEMHLALASRDDLPEFKPELIGSEDVDFWTADLLTRAERIFEMLENRRHSLADVEDVLLERVLRAKADLKAQAIALARPCVGRWKIRHHGDLHLGQVLVADQDAYIIDFEGEPSRPTAERRRKAPAARDVAGVVRSLDYSAMAAFQRWKGVKQDRQDEIGGALRSWRDDSVAAFLNSYLEAAAGSKLWPSHAPDADSMIGFFLLEKAFYEVEYELSYRPDWVSVPLRGIARILDEKDRG